MERDERRTEAARVEVDLGPNELILKLLDGAWCAVALDVRHDLPRSREVTQFDVQLCFLGRDAGLDVGCETMCVARIRPAPSDAAAISFLASERGSAAVRQRRRDHVISLGALEARPGLLRLASPEEMSGLFSQPLFCVGDGDHSPSPPFVS